LRPVLRAAQVARDDRERELGGERGDVAPRALDQRPDDVEPIVVGAVARRHRLQLAAVEQVEQEGLERVVAVVAERDLVAAEALGGGVEDAAAQARAQRAVGGRRRERSVTTE
jgi:hypothetical protein